MWFIIGWGLILSVSLYIAAKRHSHRDKPLEHLRRQEKARDAMRRF